MVIKLTSDYSVSLDSLYFERTYAGLMEGLPTPDINAEILAKASAQMVPLWGQRKTHVISPLTRQERGRTILSRADFLRVAHILHAHQPALFGFRVGCCLVCARATRCPTLDDRSRGS